MIERVIYSPGEEIVRLDQPGEYLITLLQLPDAPGDYSWRFELAAPGTTAQIRAITVGREDSQHSLNIVLHHQAVDTEANFVGKAVLSGASRLDFKGLIRIDEGAEHTRSFLEHRSMLRDPQCQVNPVPSLEILCDSVTASHSAAVSRLDAEQLFYAASRGLDPAVAEQLLTEAFLATITDTLPEPWPHTILQHLQR